MYCTNVLLSYYVVVQAEPQEFSDSNILERKPVYDAGNQFVVDGVFSIAELWKIL